MKKESRHTEAGNGRYQQNPAAFSQNNIRKASYQSAIDTRQSPCLNSNRLPSIYRLTANKSVYMKTPSFTDDSSDGDKCRSDRRQHETTSTSASKTSVADNTYSTTSSILGSRINYNAKIEHFKVVVMGDVFDGIKHRGQINTRFAASSLLMPPEASELTMPTF